jgi:putative transposase
VGKKTGPNPTDRAKQGAKRSLLTDGQGIPLAVATAGANRNDHKLARETLENIEAERPQPGPKGAQQHLCLDKGYDYPEVRLLLEEFGFTVHLRRRGEEAQKLKRRARAKARRWVVERTHSWLNRFRGLLIRWSKKANNYLGLLHLALGLITYRATGLLG